MSIDLHIHKTYASFSANVIKDTSSYYNGVKSVTLTYNAPITTTTTTTTPGTPGIVTPVAPDDDGGNGGGGHYDTPSGAKTTHTGASLLWTHSKV